ncbi:phosphopyruvate hydratase [Natronolimnobius baerhuensis]|uniref:Enolase n=1 Tax=Natronolimnobius baerhuensis TaxID=253108 RepID=A0A202E7J3_9EURY|nr:phosphopyruvate hydratase [Natronolimnobius baerhuensis]OVE84232.1 phosphopyruvate hydratase [Natronolimnobius baerhuensis]
MTLITDVRLRRILDSRGNPTVEADVITESGGFGRAAAPSGASTGEYEAIEKPPGEAIAAAREHAVPRLVGDAYAGNQREVDSILHAADGTDDFSKIGANSAVAISMAAAKAGADVLGAPLFQHLGGAFRGENFPVPLGNVVGGGEHAADATDIQEFLAVPVGAPNVEDAVFANAAVHAAVADLLEERDVPSGKGDEGAWAPSINDEDAFELVDEAVSLVEDEVGFQIEFGLDVAAAEMYDADSETYEYESAGISRDTDEQIDYIAGLVKEYNLVYVEDPLDENDYEAFAELTDRVGDQTLICGDDLFVTNTERLTDGIAQDAANSILIKPNQIGTLTDAFDAIELATENGYDSVISHRSGETEDTTIAHLAVATDAPFIKTGAVGGERTAKLNELIRIADDAT